jgi:hypothetical protein
MSDNAKRTGAAIEAHYQFLMWLALTIEKFPRPHKFAVGDRYLPGAAQVWTIALPCGHRRGIANACVCGQARCTTPQVPAQAPIIAARFKR